MPKVFIAAPWSKRNKASTVALELEHYGVTIGHRWWDTEDTKDPADYAKHARLDLLGVEEADFMVGLVDEKLGVGMWVEVGAALLRGKQVYLVNVDKIHAPPPSRSIYDSLCTSLTYLELIRILSDKRREALTGT